MRVGLLPIAEESFRLSAACQAYKGKGEQYRLFWPEEQEFVRMAAKFGATIIPFSAVGSEDGFDMVMDAKEIQELPFVGDFVRGRLSEIPRARR
jgi:hypothetical protein